MDDPRDQFQPTARELLERHIAETSQPKPVTPEISQALEEPTRPEGHAARYAQGVGDYVSETTAALRNDAMINREYHAHERNVQQEVEQAEQAGPQKNEPTSAREALEQHFKNAASEVTEPKIDPFDRGVGRERLQEYER